MLSIIYHWKRYSIPAAILSVVTVIIVIALPCGYVSGYCKFAISTDVVTPVKRFEFSVPYKVLVARSRPRFVGVVYKDKGAQSGLRVTVYAGLNSSLFASEQELLKFDEASQIIHGLRTRSSLRDIHYLGEMSETWNPRRQTFTTIICPKSDNLNSQICQLNTALRNEMTVTFPFPGLELSRWRELRHLALENVESWLANSAQ